VIQALNSVNFSVNAVYEALTKLPNKFSSGPDGIPPIFYRNLAPFLAVPLASIFNISVGTGRIPQEWSKAKVIPIFKQKGSAACAENYRPISLTNVACKLMESLIKTRLDTHFSSNNLLSDYQYGFVNG